MRLEYKLDLSQGDILKVAVMPETMSSTEYLSTSLIDPNGEAIWAERSIFGSGGDIELEIDARGQYLLLIELDVRSEVGKILTLTTRMLRCKADGGHLIAECKR